MQFRRIGLGKERTELAGEMLSPGVTEGGFFKRCGNAEKAIDLRIYERES